MPIVRARRAIHEIVTAVTQSGIKPLNWPDDQIGAPLA